MWASMPTSICQAVVVGAYIGAVWCEGCAQQGLCALKLTCGLAVCVLHLCVYLCASEVGYLRNCLRALEGYKPECVCVST